MGADRSPIEDGISGLILPDTRLILANEVAQGVGTTDSSYTQAGPLPGVPENTTSPASQMVLSASGSQSASGSLEIRALKAGMPGRDSGSMIWRDLAAGESATQYRGNDGYHIVRDWTSLRNATSGTYANSTLGMLRLQTGVVLLYGDQDDSTANYAQKVHRYSPDTGTWSTVSPSTDDGVADLGSAMVQLEDRTILWFVPTGSGSTRNLDLYTSVTAGLTWSLAARNVLEDGLPTPGGHTALTPLSINAACLNGQISLWWRFASTDGGAVVRYSVGQFASSTRGASFKTVVASWYTTYGEETFSPVCVVVSDGAFVRIAEMGAVSGAVKALRYSTAFSIPSGTAVEAIAFGNGFSYEAENLTAWADEEGILWAVARSSYVTLTGKMQISRSTTGGLTWEDEVFFHSVDNDYTLPVAQYLYGFAATSVAGRCLIATRWETGAGTYDARSVGVILTGGDSTHTAPLPSSGTQTYPEALTQQPFYDSNATLDGACYLPLDIPTNLGWTGIGTGAAGNATLQTVSGEIVLEVDTTGGGFPSWGFEVINTETGFTSLYAMFAFDEVSGGNTANDTVAVKLRLSDNTAWGYEVQVRIAAASWRLYDTAAAANVGVSQTATGKVWVCVALSKTAGPVGKVQTWFTTDTGHDKIWTPGTGGTLTEGFAGGLTDTRVRFGHFNAGTSASSRWWIGAYTLRAGPFAPGGSSDIGNSSVAGINPTDLHGRNFSSTGSRIFDGVILSAKSGPALLGDTWEVNAQYQYPASNLYPLIVGSPSQGWRSTTDGSDHVFCWQWSLAGYSQRFRNFLLAVGLFNSNFRTGTLEGYDGAAWNTLATLDTGTGLVGLGYTAAGGGLAVNTGSATASRYLWENELAGAGCKITDGVTTKYRVIESNTAGIWKDSTTVRKPIIYLASFDGTEPTTGTIDIYPRSSVTVAHNITASYRFVRLKIPAQDTADNDLRIGTLVIGALAAFGARYSFGWSLEHQPNVELLTRPSGVTRPYVRGPSGREVTLSWDDALLYQDVVAGTDPAYIRATSGGSVVGSRNDTLHLLQSIASSGNGAAQPMILLPQIPTTSGTINDPTRFMLCRLLSSPRLEDARGRYNGTDAMGRMPVLTFREER